MNRIFSIWLQYGFSFCLLMTTGWISCADRLLPAEVLSRCTITTRGKCYSIFDNTSLYENAKKTCKQFAGKLASIPDQYTQDFIYTNLFKDVNQTHCNPYRQCKVWFDLFTKWKYSKDFFTSDETLHNYSNWASGQPDLYSSTGNSDFDHLCGAINVMDKLWYDESCRNDKHYFLCEREGTPCSVKDIRIPNAFFETCHDNKTLPVSTVVNVHCDDGFVMIGNKSIVCAGTGYWSQFPSCLRVCRSPVLSPHSNIFKPDFQKYHNVGKSDVVMCDPGFVLEEDPTRSHFVITCTNEGNWKNISKCVPIKKFQVTTRIIRQNSTIKLNCHLLIESPVKEWLWHKNSQIVATNHSYTTDSNGTLQIEKFGTIHEGVYTCFALSPQISIGLVSYDLKLQSTCINLSNSSVKRYVMEGTPLILDCPHAGIDESAKSIVWVKDEEPLMQTERVLIVPDGSLVISRVSYSDKGKYSCYVSWNSGRCTARLSTELSVEASAESICGNSLMMTASPWTVSLYLGDEKAPFCYGALVNDKWIVTAAYCMSGFYRKKSFKIFVRFGKDSLDIEHLPGEGNRSVPNASKIRYVESMKIHPQYAPRLFANDVALVKLRERITFSDDVQPICLTDRDLTKTKHCNEDVSLPGLVSGWGYLAVDNAENVKFQTENMSVVTSNLCHKAAAAAAVKYTDAIFCGTHNSSEESVYAANIGSPFAVENNNRVYLLGTFILGERYSRLGDYDYFTKISNYVSWIEMNIA